MNPSSHLQSSGLSVPSNKIEEYALLSQIADMYYNQDLKVTEIASKLFFSPAKVSRLLAQAREKKVVEINVRRVAGRLSDLEDHLKKDFHLKDAIVINSFQNETDIEELDILTDFASVYTSELLKGRKILGLSNGTAVNMLVSKIRPLHRCELDIVQIIGSGGGANKDLESRDLVKKMADIYPGGRSYFLNTPLYIDSIAAKEGLLKDSTISNTLSMMNHCDILLSGVGTFSNNLSLLPEVMREYLSPAHIKELSDKNAVGCVCAQFYDIHGSLIDCTWNHHCISMSFEDIRKNSMTIAIASGISKVTPILGALRAGLIDILITGSQVASKLLEQDLQ